MKLRWGIVIGLLVATGCGDDVCTNSATRALCGDYFPPYDASTPSLDASAPADASHIVIGDDGAVVAPPLGGMDSAVPDGGPAPVTATLQSFCQARYAVAKAWQARFDECCLSNDDKAVTDQLLLSDLGYQVSAGGSDTIELCNTLPSSNVTFNPASADACAAKLAAQYDAPPNACAPGVGFDAQLIDATIGHQIATPVQIPECRAALVGSVLFNGACTGSLECKDGYRCLGTVGAKTCRDPLSASSACGTTSECADGLLCVTSAGSDTGSVCRPATMPIDVTGGCQTSTECREGLLCGSEGKCVAPMPYFICQ